MARSIVNVESFLKTGEGMFRGIILILFCFPIVCGAMQKTVLWNLNIIGNKAISTELIRDSIYTEDSSHFPIFGKKRELDSVILESDLKRIIHLYQRKGYYKASIKKVDIRECGRARQCVTLEVDEGAPTRIEKILVEVDSPNSPSKSPLEMTEVFGLKPGEIFDHDRYVAGKKTIVAFLKERAYPLPLVDGKVVYDSTINKVNLKIRVVPGVAARIGYISFEGLDEVLPEDALSRLPIYTDQWFNPYLIEDAESLLGELDVFRSISIDLKPRTTDPSILDIVYTVREKPLKSLQFGFGIGIDNSRQEARLHSEWVHRNFYKHLRRFSVLAEPRYAFFPNFYNSQQSGFLGKTEVSMLHPAFYSPWQDLRTYLGFDSDLEQGFRWYGPRVGGQLERKLSRHLRGSLGYSFRYLTFYDVDLVDQPNSKLVPRELLFNKNYRLGFIDQKFSWDAREDPLEPNRGYYAGVTFAEASQMLGSAFNFIRVNPEFRAYIPMTRRATFATRVSYGQLFVVSSENSPITERFYGGGANSHRGFSYHRLSPQVASPQDSTKKLPVGGNVLFEFSAEERIRLFMIGNHWLIGALFFDAADIVESSIDLDLASLHHAIGGGLRYDSPIGIIRVDAGFRLNRLGVETLGRSNPDPGSRYAVHVSFGESF